MSTATADCSELEAYDDGFTPQQPGQFKPGLDAVTDGDYDWTILTAHLERTPQKNQLILRLDLRVEQTGLVIERPYFFDEQKKIDALGGDLSVLGFDVGQWKAPTRPFSKELPKAVAKLPGIRFKGTKKISPNKQDPDKPWHNLYINARLSDAPAATFGPNGHTAIPTTPTNGVGAGTTTVPF